jgi:Fe-Mn family superoxide dismutase
LFFRRDRNPGTVGEILVGRTVGKLKHKERKNHMMTRRQALKSSALAGAVCAAAALNRTAIAQPPPPRPGERPPAGRPGALPPDKAPPGAPPPGKGPFTLPPLPYAFDALEPYIDAQTMQIHYEKHHAAYVNNLNKNVAEFPELHRRSTEELLRDLHTLPEKVRLAVRNFGGGHYNHALFWESLRKGAGEPKGELARAIQASFGGFGNFKQQLTDAATTLFGSGWAWLVMDGKTLKIDATSNQDNPLSRGLFPVMGIDVWEHAYYLKYQNRRPEYVEAFFNVINWDHLSGRFAKQMGSAR